DIAIINFRNGDRARALTLERKRPTIVVSSIASTIAAVASVSVIVTAQETVTISLLELIRIAVSSIAAVVAVAVAVKVRTLWIVVLSSPGVVRAGVHAVLITLARGDLIFVAVTPATRAIIAAVATIWILAVWPILRAGR